MVDFPIGTKFSFNNIRNYVVLEKYEDSTWLVFDVREKTIYKTLRLDDLNPNCFKILETNYNIDAIFTLYGEKK